MNYRIVVRRFLSFIRIKSSWIICSYKGFYHKFAFVGIFMPPGTQIGHAAVISATDGGSITTGICVSFGRNSQCIARGGHITIGDNVQIGDGVIIVAVSCISIGSDTLIGEYVVIRDQDHRTDSRPIRHSGFYTNPVHIGKDVWIGCKASVLRGASVGDGCVIGAHALVKAAIPAYTLAVGLPAHVIKQLELSE